MLGESGPESARCSKRGCLAGAKRQIIWRNPKIHDESKRKVWLSCGDHEEFFVQYLGARNFPVATDDFDAEQAS